ncbi:crustacyanin-A2 subunit-like [Penaeus japonicus]|uniref:crustacyanin-A2 subunit-like n=1 Tax=Penaeus japonicus TaxID=27405 RepID=UPI001C710BAD|nr:crustacyanin-A2 subunit-like [Penaeus japonicus]
MASLTFVTVALCALGCAMALPTPDFSYVREGQCLAMASSGPLNYEMFTGRWVEAASRPNIFRRERQCRDFHFIITEADTPLRVTSGMDKDNKLTEVITELVPKAAPSTFDVQIEGFSTSDLVVVDTDYTSFACLYQCQQATPDRKVEWAFIYARDLSQADVALKRCNKVLQAQGFDVESILVSPTPKETCNTAL